MFYSRRRQERTAKRVQRRPCGATPVQRERRGECPLEAWVRPQKPGEGAPGWCRGRIENRELRCVARVDLQKLQHTAVLRACVGTQIVKQYNVDRIPPKHVQVAPELHAILRDGSVEQRLTLAAF